MDDYKSFLNGIKDASGLPMLVPDDLGFVSIRVEDAYNVNLQFIEANAKILCFIEIMKLPASAPKKVYRDMLVGGLFGKDTAGGYLAIDDDTETVVYNYLFDYEQCAKDPDDFISTLEKILQLCDFWVERISNQLDTNEKQDTDQNIIFTNYSTNMFA